MADQGSMAAQILRAIGARQAAQADATRELNRAPPQASGPTQAEMLANPNAPPVAFTRAPDPSEMLGRAQQLLKQGLITNDQYNAYAQKTMPFPTGAPFGMAGPAQN